MSQGEGGTIHAPETVFPPYYVHVGDAPDDRRFSVCERFTNRRVSAVSMTHEDAVVLCERLNLLPRRWS